MGGEPDMSYATVSWTRIMKPEDAVENICHNYWRFAEITEEVKNRFRKFVFNNLKDEVYVSQVEHLIGRMVWDAWRIKEKGLA